MLKFISICLLTLATGLRSLPVSELAGMHQMDEGVFDITQDSSMDCQGKPDGTLFGDDHDPTKFYECSNGKAITLHCPKGLIFNQGKSVCDYDPNGPTKRPPYHGNSTFDCTGKKDGFYADEMDKTAFHECVNGYPYDFHCPPNTYFEITRVACVFRDNQQQTTVRTTRDIETTTQTAEEEADKSHHGDSVPTPLPQHHKRSADGHRHHQLEDIAEEKHVDIRHEIETTTHDNFDLLD